MTTAEKIQAIQSNCELLKAERDGILSQIALQEKRLHAIDDCMASNRIAVGELEAELAAETKAEDRKAGARDARAGYYDKYYRYNRKDDGAAYDEGYKSAMSTGGMPEQRIIEANAL